MKEVLHSVHVEPLDEGGFLATSDDLPELVAQGRTLAETLEVAHDVVVGLVESYPERGDELPPKLREARGNSAGPPRSSWHRLKAVSIDKVNARRATHCPRRGGDQLSTPLWCRV